MSVINENLLKLQKLMKEKNISLYVIPTSDNHSSEYISDYFKSREFMSGFTGSAGTLLVSLTNAYLFVDGRYFIQAENQINGTNITLEKIGEPNVLSINELIKSLFKEGDNIGFDGNVLPYYEAKNYSDLVNYVGGHVVSIDLINNVWEKRPPLPNGKIFILNNKYSGKESKNKIEDIRKEMIAKNAKYNVITSLDDIAWILNLRGNDISYNPVFLSYLVIGEKTIDLFIDKSKIDLDVATYLKANKITVNDYSEIINFVKLIKEPILLDYQKVNYEIVSNIKANIINSYNPSLLMKSIKNSVEISNQKKCLIKDGVAMTKFMYWLKNNVGIIPITEISAQNKLYKLREEQEHYIEPSFNTICAYKSHAAMMHYSATKESDVPLTNEGMLLVDSGGQYLEGTTDITRTFVLGEISKAEKHHFTLVLESSLNLMRVVFLHGCTGISLDLAAREPIWKEFLDYKCGTGHGVGYLLNVHEAPNGFRYKIVPERNDSHVLEPGMITTDEPGIYLENEYGIRHENELLCKEIMTNNQGTFLGFENITMCPIDIDGIDPKELSKENREYLNNYHKKVYKTIKPFLTKEEARWLRKYTRKI